MCLVKGDENKKMMLDLDVIVCLVKGDENKKMMLDLDVIVSC